MEADTWDLAKCPISVPFSWFWQWTRYSGHTWSRLSPRTGKRDYQIGNPTIWRRTVGCGGNGRSEKHLDARNALRWTEGSSQTKPSRYVYYGRGIPSGVPCGVEHMLSLERGRGLAWGPVGGEGEGAGGLRKKISVQNANARARERAFRIFL